MRILTISVAMLMILVASASAWTLTPKIIANRTGYSTVDTPGGKSTITNYGVGLELGFPITGALNIVGEVDYAGFNAEEPGWSNDGSHLVGALNALMNLRSPFYVGAGVNYSSLSSSGAPTFSGVGFQLIGGMDIANYMAQLRITSGTLKPETGPGEQTETTLLIEVGYRFKM